MMAATSPARAADNAKVAPIEVMVLGAYHMGNPGQDLNNMVADPVTTPAKQAELAALAKALGSFRPTAIAIERTAADQATMLDQGYAAFTPADLGTKPDERVQIAYRLARDAGVTRVYAVDEQPAKGEADYFPYEAVLAWAKAHGREGDLDRCNARVGEALKELETAQRREPVAATLARVNAREGLFSDRGTQGLYYGCYLSMGAGRTLPGAELNGRWYTRNAKIFAKLQQVSKPGDRVIVIFGSGHNAWLRHFVEMTPGFRLIDPLPYLERAAKAPGG